MSDYLKHNQDLILALCALAILGGVIGFFIWGIGAITLSLDQAATTPPSPSGISSANLEAARKILESRGLLNGLTPGANPIPMASSTATSSLPVQGNSTSH